MHQPNVYRLDSGVDLGDRPMIHIANAAAYDGAE